MLLSNIEIANKKEGFFLSDDIEMPMGHQYMSEYNRTTAIIEETKK